MNKTDVIMALESATSQLESHVESLRDALEELKQPPFEYLTKHTHDISKYEAYAGAYNYTDRYVSGSHEVFQKKSHAEAKAAHMLKHGKLQQLIIEFNAEHCNGWVADWGDSEQRKGELYFHCDCSEWDITESVHSVTPGVIHFDPSYADELLALVNKHFPPEEWAKL